MLYLYGLIWYDKHVRCGVYIIIHVFITKSGHYCCTKTTLVIMHSVMTQLSIV